MRVSNRLDYAVRALIELALRDEQSPIAAREIASRRQIPDAYIHQVMAAQSDLVDVVARFDPKIVKMADAGERPED